MLGYRTIGIDELNMLLYARNPIYGRRKWQDHWECGCDSQYPYGIVCFFKEPILFKDKKHIFQIAVSLDSPMEGVGDYDVGKDFNKTKKFTGRGKINIKIPELYVRSYSLEQVKAINLRGYFANWATKTYKEICEKEGIKFYNSALFNFDEMEEGVEFSIEKVNN